MEFEFDPQKSEKNKEKHGIDFVKAQKLWKDPNRVEIPAKCVDEPRYMLIGKIGEKCWSAIFTYRYNKIRIISVRRARKDEERIYKGRRI